MNELLVAMFIFLLFLVWLLTMGVSFAVGFAYARRRKPRPEPKQISEEEMRESRRNQKELENFMNYNGRPQEIINEE